MLNIINWPRVRAEKFHNFLPEKIRSYLKGRGIPATIIEGHLLGWNGKRITMPIFGENSRKVLGFRYAKSPTDISDTPEVISDPGLGVQLYGLDKLLRKPSRIVICDGEFNRLVLEANDFAAVSSTAGADTFLLEWLPYFEGVKQVFICFNRDRAGEEAARRV
ncbi:MAG TPA: toprim domain-containing protein, partial [Candidatus Binatia bacterium]|nr:toprim domain-containing protein [Candidatus Binatia bacterium]